MRKSATRSTISIAARVASATTKVMQADRRAWRTLLPVMEGFISNLHGGRMIVRWF
jgi:hypothetical protein